MDTRKPICTTFRSLASMACVRTTCLSWLLATSVLMPSAHAAETLSKQTDHELDVIRASGKRHYEPTWESLGRHGAAPKWYEDAVFGIYFHWGVYSVPAFGSEKYPRDMYRHNSGTNKHHWSTYGDPAKFGYHDFIPMFKAEKWDPDRWATLFKNAGADFAGSIGAHHDGFAMWDSAYTPYNSKNMGPHRDVVGEMAQAARKQGMKVVTTFHNVRWDYYDAGRQLCPKGIGVNDPKLSDLYGPPHNAEDPMSESFREKGYNQVIEVIDKYRPDHLQFDGTTCENLGEDGKKKFLAHYFNAARKWGKEVVVTRGFSSRHPYSPSEIWGKEVMTSRVIPLSCSVQNMERRFPTIGRRTPWLDMQQATTPVPGFGYAYAAGREDKTPAEIEDSVNSLVDGMVDVTSKNGVTLLSVAPKADGTLPDSQVRILKKLGGWMRVNKEALYGADCRTPCAADTLRFTRKGHYLYAFDLEKPRTPVVIPGVTPVPDSAIRMLGNEKKLAWRQETGNVVIDELPDSLPGDYAWVFKIRVDEATDESQRTADEKDRR
jgi:alpha-L-fucosidase